MGVGLFIGGGVMNRDGERGIRWNIDNERELDLDFLLQTRFEI